jgi:hypothetical protein
MAELSEGSRKMSKLAKIVLLAAVLASCLSLTGCSGNVGVGVSVGVPVGSHGHVSVGTHRWL